MNLIGIKTKTTENLKGLDEKAVLLSRQLNGNIQTSNLDGMEAHAFYFDDISKSRE